MEEVFVLEGVGAKSLWRVSLAREANLAVPLQSLIYSIFIIIVIFYFS